MPLPTIDIPTIPPYRNLAPAVKYGYCLIVNSKTGYSLVEPLQNALLDKDPMKALDAIIIDRATSKDATGTHMASYMREIYYDPYRHDATQSLGGILRLTEHNPVLPDGMVWARFLDPISPWFYEDPTVLSARAKRDGFKFESQTHNFAMFDTVLGVGGVYVKGLPRSWVRPDDDRRRPSKVRAANIATVFRAYLKDGLEGVWTACEDMASGSPGLRYAINCEAPWVDPSPTVQDDWRRAMILATKQIDTIDND